MPKNLLNHITDRNVRNVFAESCPDKENLNEREYQYYLYNRIMTKTCGKVMAARKEKKIGSNVSLSFPIKRYNKARPVTEMAQYTKEVFK